MATGTTISQRIALEGVQDIVRQLQAMGATGEEAIRRIHGAARNVSGSFDQLEHSTGRASRAIHEHHGAVSNLENAVGPALSRLNRFSHAFEELRGAMGALAPAMKEFVEVGIGAAFLLAARSAASATREIVNQAAELGMTTKEFEGLSYAAASVGISMETSRRLFDRFMARLGEAQRGIDDFTQAQGIHSEERRIQQEKLNQTIAREEDVIARARRAQENAGHGLQQIRVDQERYNMAINQGALETHKLEVARKAATDALGHDTRSLDKRLQAGINQQKEEIHVGEAKLALDGKIQASNEARVSHAEQIRHAEQQIATARAEYALNEEKAQSQAEKTKDEFSRMGISLRNAAGEFKNGKEIFSEFADKLNLLPTAAEKAATMLKVFGRGWSEALPLIRLGSHEIERLSEEFEKTGTGLKETEIAMAINFNASWNKMLFVLESMKNVLGNITGQVWVPFFDAITRGTIGSAKSLREFGDSFVKIAVPAAQAAVEVFTVLGAVLGVLKSSLDFITKGINTVLGTKMTGSDLIVGFIAFEIAIKTVLPLLAALRYSLAAVEAQTIALVGSTGLLARTWALLSLESMLTGIGNLSNAFGKLTASLLVARSAVAALAVAAAPFLVFAAAIGIVGLAIYALIDPTEKLGKLFGEIFGEDAGRYFNQFFGVMRNGMHLIGGDISKLWGELTNGFNLLVDDFKTFGGWIAAGANRIMAALKPITDWASWALQPFQGFFNLVRDVFAYVYDKAARLNSVLRAILDTVIGIFSQGGSSSESTSAEASSGTTASQQEAFNKRFAEDFPAQAATSAHHATGGWIGGSGRGDRVPIMAEPGEFMVRRSVAQRFGDFLSALNAGMVGGFSMGGIVDALNSVAPAPVRAAAMPAANPANDQALFHLTIGDKTFSNLSAPQDTANEMLRYARTSGVASLGKKPSHYGSG